MHSFNTFTIKKYKIKIKIKHKFIYTYLKNQKLN